MSVLKSLKGTIINVQQDISSGIKSLRSPTKSGDDPNISLSSGKVNLNAGADLLHKYQEAWSELHQNSEDCAKVAQEADSYVTDIYLKLEKQNDAMGQFLVEASNIPQVITDVKNVMDKIGKLEVLFSDVQTQLTQLEDLNAAQDLVKNKNQHLQQLSMYRRKKEMELEQVKVRLASAHAKKVHSYEARLQGMIREKQQAFEAAFSEEMTNYKKFGQTQFKPTPQHPAQPSLDEINIEQDPAALDDFLSTDTPTEQDHSTPPGDLEVGTSPTEETDGGKVKTIEEETEEDEEDQDNDEDTNIQVKADEDFSEEKT